jgi:hypothetical protein
MNESAKWSFATFPAFTRSWALGCVEVMVSAVFCRDFSFISVMAILSHPAAAKALAVASPIPR